MDQTPHRTARRPVKSEARFRTLEDIEQAGDRAVENILRAVGAYDVAQPTLDRCAVHAASCGFPDPDFVLARHKDWYSELEAIRTAGGGGPYHSRIVEARQDPDGAFARWFEDHVRQDDYYLVRIVPGAARLEAAGLFGDAMHANLFHEIVWPREIALARVMRLGRQKQKAALAQIFLAQAREQPAMAYVGLAGVHRQRDGIEIDEIVDSGAGPDAVTASAFEAMEEGPAGVEIDFDNLLNSDPLWLRWILAEEGDIAGELNRLPKDDFNDLVRAAREEASVEQKEELRRRYAAQLRDPETRRGPWLDVSFVSRARTLGYTPNQYVAAVDRLVRYRVGRDAALDGRISADDPGSLLVSWLEAHASDRPEPEALGRARHGLRPHRRRRGQSPVDGGPAARLLASVRPRALGQDDPLAAGDLGEPPGGSAGSRRRLRILPHRRRPPPPRPRRGRGRGRRRRLRRLTRAPVHAGGRHAGPRPLRAPSGRHDGLLS